MVEPGRLESPRYGNRSHVPLNGTSDLSGGPKTVDQLQKDLTRLRSTMDNVKCTLTDQIHDLVGELDEEKKARAALHIEVERLQKLIQKSGLNKGQ